MANPRTHELSGSEARAMRDNVSNLRDNMPSEWLLPVASNWWAMLAECQRDMVDFVADRMAKDKEVTREILQARDVNEVVAIQSKWISDTSRDYTAQMTKLMEKCTGHVEGSARHQRSRHTS